MRLSVVIPVYNEAAVLDELTRRARAAALQAEGHDPEAVHAGVRDEVDGARVLANFLAVAFAR